MLQYCRVFGFAPALVAQILSCVVVQKLSITCENNLASGLLKTLASNSERPCSRLSIVQLANDPKRSMGHVLRAKKGIFLIRGRGRPTVYGGRACGIQSIPAQEVSLGSPRAGTIHVHAPTPLRRRFMHFWPISLSRPLGLAIFWPWFASRALREH